MVLGLNVVRERLHIKGTFSADPCATKRTEAVDLPTVSVVVVDAASAR